MSKGVNERIDERVLQWFSHIEIMGDDRIAKKVYVGKCIGSRKVGRTRKMLIDSVNDCLKKTCLNAGQTWCMIGINARGLWWGMLGACLGYEPLTLTRCYSGGFSQLYKPFGV